MDFVKDVPRKIAVFLAFILTVIPIIVNGVTLEQDLKLTLQQKQALDRFKARVINKLPEKYMKYDIYLIRFLRARNFDINMAERFLMENIKWRRENKMTQILNEDFSDLEDEIKIYTESIDRQGRPIITSNFGEWNLRRGVVSGQLRRLNRYTDKYNEAITTKVRKFQAEGKNVTQYDVIINMLNYNIVQHGCNPCIPFYIYLTDSYERHWPGAAHKIILINTPPVFQQVLNAITPFMSPLTRRILRVYGQNKRQWEPELRKLVDKSELPPEYGGTKRYEEKMITKKILERTKTKNSG